MFSNTQNKIGCLKATGFLLFVAVLVSPQPGQAASVKESVRQGNRLYRQGQFEDSLKMFQEALRKEPESDIVNFNTGTALYKQKHYDEAVDHFQKAILSNDTVLRERAYYNLGNSFYRSGIAKEKTDINTAIARLQESLKHLASALALDKNDQDAQYNYDFVSKELERLRKEQQKQQQQSQQDQNGPKDQEQQQQQDPQSGQGRSDSAGGEKEQQQSGAQQSGQQDNSSQSKSGESQEQTQQEKESSAEESEKQAASGEKSEGERGQAGEQGQQQGSTQSASVAQGQELTKIEAERLLQNYQQTEEPQGLLHVFQEKHETGAVIKDW